MPVQRHAAPPPFHGGLRRAAPEGTTRPRRPLARPAAASLRRPRRGEPGVGAGPPEGWGAAAGPRPPPPPRAAEGRGAPRRRAAPLPSPPAPGPAASRPRGCHSAAAPRPAPRAPPGGLPRASSPPARRPARPTRRAEPPAAAPTHLNLLSMVTSRARAAAPAPPEGEAPRPAGRRGPSPCGPGRLSAAAAAGGGAAAAGGGPWLLRSPGSGRDCTERRHRLLPPVSQFLLPRLRHPLGTRKLRGRPGNRRGRRQPDVRPPQRASEPRAALPRLRAGVRDGLRAEPPRSRTRPSAPAASAPRRQRPPVARRTAALRGVPGVALRCCPAAFPSFPIPLNSLHSKAKLISSC